MYRMYENKTVPVDAPDRFRVEVSLSPGSAFDPISTVPPEGDHTLGTVPRVQLNLGTTDTLASVSHVECGGRKISCSICSSVLH